MAESRAEPAVLAQVTEALRGLVAGPGTTIECEFENLEVQVPQGSGPTAGHLLWRIHGTLRIRASEVVPPP
jgi:hypothetical protein